MDLVVYDDEDRRYVPWRVSVAAVVLTALLAAATAFLLAGSLRPEQLGGRSAPQAASSSASAPPTASSAPAPSPSASPQASPPSPGAPIGPTAAPSAEVANAACTAALAQADAVAQRSTALEQALAAHTRIMDELLAQRLTTEQALDETLPVLTRGATERDRFRDELAAYESSRRACTD